MSLLQRGAIVLPIGYKKKLANADAALAKLREIAAHSVQRNEMYDALATDSLVLHDLMNSTAEHMNSIHGIGFDLLPRPDTRVALSDVLKSGRVSAYNLLAVTHALSSALHQMADMTYTTTTFNEEVKDVYQDAGLESIEPFSLPEHLVELQSRFGESPHQVEPEPPTPPPVVLESQVATSSAVQSTNMVVARQSARKIR